MTDAITNDDLNELEKLAKEQDPAADLETMEDMEGHPWTDNNDSQQAIALCCHWVQVGRAVPKLVAEVRILRKALQIALDDLLELEFSLQTGKYDKCRHCRCNTFDDGKQGHASGCPIPVVVSALNPKPMEDSE